LEDNLNQGIGSQCDKVAARMLEVSRTSSALTPNKPLQRSGIDKVLGRGRGEVVLEQVRRARVLKRFWPAAERGW
jgi:hypothetical protein